MRVNICSVEIDLLSFSEVIDKIISHIKLGSKPEYVVTPNAQHIALLQSRSEFRQAYDNAFLVVPDGVSLLWAAKVLGTPLKNRVNGTDLFEGLCEISAQENFKIFLLGGLPGSADAAADLFLSRYPNLDVVGTYCPPLNFEKDEAEMAQVRAHITSAKPDLLFVALGSPKQEVWICENYQDLGVPVSIGIGASFELASGVVPRAPKFLRETGLEWFFRLLVEPRRLWKRYLVTNSAFIWLVFKQRIKSFH